MINRIYHSDNLPILKDMPASSIDLVYIDPPFFTGQKFKSKRGQHAFEDKFESLNSYIDFIYYRALEIHRVLKDTGSIFLHCDWRASHRLRAMLDYIFGEENFANELIWFYPDTPGRSSKYYSRKHDNIYFYSKTQDYIFNRDNIRTPILEKSKKRYKTSRKLGSKEYIGGISSYIGKIPEDVFRISSVKGNSYEHCGYPTQKPIRLLKRIINMACPIGGTVADFFSGSGTTLAAAHSLNRNWIGVDNSKEAIATIVHRFQKDYNFQVPVFKEYLCQD